MATAPRACALALLALVACGEPEPPASEPTAMPAPEETEETVEIPEALAAQLAEGGLSPNARIDTWQMLREDLEAPRSEADGGGRAWLVSAAELAPGDGTPRPLEGPEDGVRAGGRGRFELAYEAGPLGVAEGGVVFLQVSPFWDWDSPQTEYPDAPGYTEVWTEAEGIELAPHAIAQGLLAIPIAGRPLAEGERIHIRFGAGRLGARVDRYAERGSQFWLAVDGDGDGVRALVSDPPRVRIRPGLPAGLRVTGPTTARVGQKLEFTVAVLDRIGNGFVPVEAEVTLDAAEGLELPPFTSFPGDPPGILRARGVAREPGRYRVVVRGQGRLAGLGAESNPLWVDDALPTVLWADLHGHSNLSDGTGTPEDYFHYARHVAALDVAALTDHDHWGMQLLDAHPAMWDRIRRATAAAHDPPHFVTVLGYEWTSWLHGHRHVLYFHDFEASEEAAEQAAVLSSLDDRYQTPSQLWAGLRGRTALTFAHHSAGGPVATNWRHAPPPELEPVTEIVSVHGNSEAADAPAFIYDPVAGNTVRDALAHGYRLGFIGSGDSHDGHPGLAQLASGTGRAGIAGILAAEPSRAGVLEALRARRVYATNGPRILLDVELDGRPMGSDMPEADARGAPWPLRYRIAGEAPIARIDFIRSGLTASAEVAGERHVSGLREVPPLGVGEFLYLRVVQEDGGAAWSSPFFGPPRQP